MELPSKLPALKYIGFAVTDTGVAKDTQAIKDLAEFLYRCFQAIPGIQHRFSPAFAFSDLELTRNLSIAVRAFVFSRQCCLRYQHGQRPKQRRCD